MLPDLGEVAVCRRYVMHPSSSTLLVIRALCSTLFGLYGLFCYGELTIVGSLVGMAGPWSS